jgi:ribosomal protein S18 acetylase RimI-like enzyme
MSFQIQLFSKEFTDLVRRKISMLQHLDVTNVTVAQRILDIQQLAYLQESILIDYPNLPPLKETLLDIQTSGESFLGYYEQNALAGVLSYSLEQKTLTIQRLVVHPTCTRRGIGRALLQELIHQHRHIKTFTVSTAEKNIPAVKLYEKHGFEITQRHTTPDGLALVRLKKHQSV